MRYLVAMVLGACGLRSAPVMPVGQVEQGILQGTIASADRSVFVVQITSRGESFLCSGTLVGAKSILTAAHCVDVPEPSVRVTNVVDRSTAKEADYIAVTRIEKHPMWQPDTHANDFAFLLLERSATEPPKAWNSRDARAVEGADVRLAGYGEDESGVYGVKRQVQTVCVHVNDTRLIVDQRAGIGACHGDSGGPMYAVFDDGIERLVGVNTGALAGSGQLACESQGVYGRVDIQRAFILQWFAKNEDPQCVQDGMCKADCDVPDVDCLCQGDGYCSSDCPNLLDDPDCPRDCVDNDECAEEDCPVPDPDCIAVGVNCTVETQCQSRACINDAQNDDPYCSMSCLRDADCDETMSCNSVGWCIKRQLRLVHLGQACTAGETRCTDGTECAGGKCVQPCAHDANCKSGQVCSGVDAGVRFCKVGASSLGAGSPAASSGCNHLPAQWMSLFALLVLRRRRA